MVVGSGGGKACKQIIVRTDTILTSSRYNSVPKETVINFPWGVECLIEEVTIAVELSHECKDRAF